LRERRSGERERQGDGRGQRPGSFYDSRPHSGPSPCLICHARMLHGFMSHIPTRFWRNHARGAASLSPCPTS
jgi:hypothetical protein